MGRKIISTQPFPRPAEAIAGDEAFPRPCADDCGNARPPSTRRADAKQPGETASRLLRIVPATPENTICWRDFSVLQSLFLPEDLAATVSLYLLNMDLHLMQIARSRACRDFQAVAQEAHAIARIAGNLGALSVRAAAHQLEQSCHAGYHEMTYGLISALSQACSKADVELNKWLEQNPTQFRS